MATSAQVSQHRFDAVFVDQAQSSARDAQTHPTVFAFNPETLVLQVRQKTAFCFVVSVGDVVPHLRALARDVTYASHGSFLLYAAKPISMCLASPRQIQGGGIPCSPIDMHL